VEHKIQSSDGPLNVQLQLVPKMLRPLVFKWTPQAFIISFKVGGQDLGSNKLPIGSECSAGLSRPV